MRFPIALKLASATSALAVVLAASFVWAGDRMLEQTYADQADRLRAERTAELERRSIAVAHFVGDTAGEALAGTETGRLARVLDRIVRENPEITFAAISDESGRLLVHSGMTVDEALRSGIRFDVDRRSGGTAVAEVRRNGQVERSITYPISQGLDPSVLGFLRLGWSLDQLREGLAEIERRRELDVRRTRLLVGTAGIVAVAAGVLAGILGGVGFSRPLRRLVRTARSIAGGDLGARADVRSSDEIGDLASTMNHMAGRIEALVEQTRGHAEIEKELALARMIQQELLPGRDLIERPGLGLAGFVEPASSCGGDWWAYVPLTRQRTLVLVGDVTGHGLSSAMLTATARSCLDTVRQLTESDFRAGHLLRIMDRLLRESVGEDFHMTAFASILDPLEGTLTYANAGHNQPFLFRRTETGWRQGRLGARGNRLGDADGHAFVEHTITTRPDDILCWYTDGLVDAVDADLRPFGTRRLRACLAHAAGQPPGEILAHVLRSFQAHRSGTPLDDDVTCVVGRVSG